MHDIYNACDSYRTRASGYIRQHTIISSFSTQAHGMLHYTIDGVTLMHWEMHWEIFKLTLNLATIKIVDNNNGSIITNNNGSIVISNIY